MATKSMKKFLSEDVVYRKSREGKYQLGLVVKSGVESDSDDDEPPISGSCSKLSAGCLRVAWYPTGKFEDLHEDAVNLFDRSLLPGDVVRSCRGNVSEQLGLILNTSSKITVKILGTNQVISNVTPLELENCMPLTPEVLCVYEGWVGFIVDVEFDVIMSTIDGGQLVTSDLELQNIFEMENGEQASHFEKKVYVGQSVVTRKKHLRHVDIKTKSKITEVLSDPDEPGSLEILLTVQEVIPSRTEIRWIMQTIEKDEKDNRPPARDTFGKEILHKIKTIDCFAKNSFCTGDRGYFIVRPDDILTPFEDWQYQVKDTDSESEPTNVVQPTTSVGMKSSISRRKKKLALPISNIRNMKLKPSKKLKVPLIETAPGSKVPVEVVCTETTASVLWQDGSLAEGVPSFQLQPVLHLDNHEYFPGDFVVDNKKEISNVYGVVQTVDHAARTVNVLWVEEHGIEPKSKEIEAVSVYDLKDHPDFQFRPGSCVVRLIEGLENIPPTERCVGQVVKLTESGKLECIWADGSTELVYPQTLLFVGDYDEDDLWDDSDYNDSDMETDCQGSDDEIPRPSSQKEKVCLLLAAVNDLELWLNSNDTVNRKNQVQSLKMVIKLCKAVKETGLYSSGIDLTHLQELLENSQAPPSFSGDFWSRISSKVSEMLKKPSSTASPSPQTPSTSRATVTLQSSKTDSPVSRRTSLGLETLQKIKTQLFPLCGAESSKVPEPSPVKEVEGDSVQTVAKVVISSSNSQLKVMETVPTSHRFKLSVMSPNRMKEFMARVREEFSILSTSLPSDIFVKTFEDRMDLFSVMIKGPGNTPYEGGLFLFDVQLPADYPRVPPVVNYLSFCRDRLNPNLYECGKVCVSLLGTWTGKGSENWGSKSNLLQLFVSIQGLILVREPYFNEAGYMNQRGTPEGLENSRLYNEMAVVKLVQSMNQMLANPPEAFASEIRDHIKITSGAFTSRLKEWIRISEDFTADPSDLKKEEAARKSDFPLLPASKGFCLSLKKALADFEKTLLLRGQRLV